MRAADNSVSPKVLWGRAWQLAGLAIAMVVNVVWIGLFGI